MTSYTTIRTGLVADADTDHEDARGWYESYGWHISTESAGDVCVQAVEYDWLDHDDDTVVGLLMTSNADLTLDEADSIVAKARDVRDAAESVESSLDDAVDAYERGDYEAVIKAIGAATAIEREHGDSPAANALRAQLVREDA